MIHFVYTHVIVIYVQFREKIKLSVSDNE